MSNGPFESRLRILSSAFRYADQPWAIGRAELYPDRIRLTTWGPSRRPRVTISINAISDVAWPDGEDHETQLRLDSGEQLALRLAKSRQWQRYLGSRLEWRDRSAEEGLPAGRTGWTLRDIIHYSGSMS